MFSLQAPSKRAADQSQPKSKLLLEGSRSGGSPGNKKQTEALIGKAKGSTTSSESSSSSCSSSDSSVVGQNNNNNNNNITKSNKSSTFASSAISTSKQNSTQATRQQATNSPNKANNHKMTYCSQPRWLVFLFMSLTFTLAAILIAILTANLLERQDECRQEPANNLPGYRFFSTKTTYSTASSFLNHTRQSTSFASNAVQNPPEVPQIFSPTHSLQTLHQWLTEKVSQSPGSRLEPAQFDAGFRLSAGACTARQLHYFGRHAARFPSSSSIEELNRHLANIQARIRLPQLASLPVQVDANQDMPATASNATVCFDPLAQYKGWASLMNRDMGNLVMPSGLQDTLALARRLKDLMPEMFRANETRVHLGTTDELRTAQTALMFVAELENFPLACRLDQFPVYDTLDRVKALELINNECYQTFLSQFNTSKLAFHKTCRKLHRENLPIFHNLNLDRPNRTQSIAASVSKKLKLDKSDQLSIEETKAIYDLCKYESALSGSSIWCQLFSDQDLKLYEYLNDIDDFFNQAYGHPDQMRSACPVTRDLMAAFKSAAKRASTTQDGGKPLREANFYFTHSEVLQKILAASVDLENDPEYMPKNILANLNAGQTPDSRQWQTSLFTPFSGNLAFILYECPRADRDQPRDEPTIEFYAGDSTFKVVASLNERPIQLDGCSSVVCDLNELLSDSRIDREKRCKMEDICKKNITVS